MSIRSVKSVAVNIPFEVDGPRPLFAGKPREYIGMLLVCVETESGIVGWGEAFSFVALKATGAAVDSVVGPLAIGEDERDIEGIMLKLHKLLHLCGRTGPVIYALSGLEIALWDIAGKEAGRPLAELIGGISHSDLPAYASLMRYANSTQIGRQAASSVSRGYSGIKLHTVEVDQVRAAREAIGPDIKLMMDTNCSWDVNEALATAKRIRDFDLFWVEEPVWPPEDYASLASVRRECGIQIAAGENAMNASDFRAMFDEGAVDFAQPSITKIGGIAEWMKVARLATERHVLVVPHSPYFGPGLLATLHVAATLEHETMIEHYYCDLIASPLGNAIEVVNGRVAIPQGPGLGHDPDPTVLKRYAID